MKRLIIQPELVQQLGQYMPPSIYNNNHNSNIPVAIYLSSDCEDVAKHMKQCFLEYGNDKFRLLTSWDEYINVLVPTGMFIRPPAPVQSSSSISCLLAPEYLV